MRTVSSLTAPAMLLMKQHHGIITTGQLTQSRVGRRARDRLVAAGIIQQLHRSVYRITSAPLTLSARCVALCFAHPTGFITGPTAGRLVGLRRMPHVEPIVFSVSHGLELDIDPRLVTLRQSTKVDESDIHRRSDGINIAAPWRLAFDLAADLRPLDHASVVEQILHEKLCGIGALRMAAKRLAHPNRPGSRLFVKTLADRVPGGALESHPEVLLAKALRARGIPVEAQTTWLTLPNGRKVRIDLSVAAVRWGVEVDVHPDHLLLGGTTNDKGRDRQCRLIGWQVDRVTELDLLDLHVLVEELAALYLLRCAAYGAALAS